MATQLNLKLPENLLVAARTYADSHGYRNIQELVYQSVREKVFESGFDESFTEKEIRLVDRIIDKTLANKKRLVGEKELRAALRK